MTPTEIPDIPLALSAYAHGLFPMDDLRHQDEPLPWYTADPRWVFELDEDARAHVRRTVRRSLAKAGDDWVLRRSESVAGVLDGCSEPRPDDGIWLTNRLCALYRRMHNEGALHTHELWIDGELSAGIIAVTLGRASMLESMFHRVPHAGNVLLSRTLDRLAEEGFEVCDVQLATDHTRRLGARPIPARRYNSRLRWALRDTPIRPRD